MHDDPIPPPAPQQLPLQRLADARRVLEINCDHPLMSVEDRQVIRSAKRFAWATIAEVAETLVATLDAAAGDPDLEDATDAEDEGIQPQYLARDVPGCVLGLEPWMPSPIEAVGPTPWPPGRGGHEYWPQAIELRQQIEAELTAGERHACDP